MKIKKLSIKEAKEIISKLLDEHNAFYKAKWEEWDKIDKKYPLKFGEENLERDKAFKEHEEKYDFDKDDSYSKICELVYHAPISENKQCCKNCSGEAFCIKRRYVSHSYYICDDYTSSCPSESTQFSSSDSICKEKTRNQEIQEYLDKYKKLFKYADDCEKAVTKEILPLPEKAYKKADEYIKAREAARKAYNDCWVPKKITIMGEEMTISEFDPERARKVSKEHNCCPMSLGMDTILGPIVADKDKVDYKEE